GGVYGSHAHRQSGQSVQGIVTVELGRIWIRGFGMIRVPDLLEIVVHVVAVFGDARGSTPRSLSGPIQMTGVLVGGFRVADPSRAVPALQAFFGAVARAVELIGGAFSRLGGIEATRAHGGRDRRAPNDLFESPRAVIGILHTVALRKFCAEK